MDYKQNLIKSAILGKNPMVIKELKVLSETLNFYLDIVYYYLKWKLIILMNLVMNYVVNFYLICQLLVMQF